MKSYTKRFTLTGNKQTGDVVESSNGNLLATAGEHKVWFPAKASIDKYITFNVHEKGDTFVATNDSSRTFGETLSEVELADLAKERKTTAEELADLPLFNEGDTVTRQSPSIEWIGFTSEPEEKEELSFEEKAKILAKLGVKISLA